MLLVSRQKKTSVDDRQTDSRITGYLIQANSH